MIKFTAAEVIAFHEQQVAAASNFARVARQHAINRTADEWQAKADRHTAYAEVIREMGKNAPALCVTP